MKSKRCKQVLSVFLCVVMLLSAVPLQGLVGFNLPKFDLFNFDVSATIANGDLVYDVFSYKIENNQITITDCSTMATGKIDIPENIEGYEVVKIANSAFDNCRNITVINIPSTVTTVCSSNEYLGMGDFFHNFYECTSLTAINVDEKNDAYRSVDGILYNKSMTRLIRYPSGKIGEKFVVPESVEWITAWSFYNNDNLTDIQLDNKYYSFGDYIFRDCSKLTNINLPTVSTYPLYLTQGMFMNCTALTDITIPDVFKNDGSISTCDPTNHIWYGPFYGCTGLKTATINAPVIDRGAFAYCTSLNTVTLNENISVISEYAFAYSGVVSIEIPKSVTDSSKTVFIGCNQLESISVETDKQVDWYISVNLPALKQVTYGADVTNYISDIETLEEIIVDEKNQKFASYDGVLYNKEKTVLLAYPQSKSDSSFNSMPSTVETISNDAFKYSKYLVYLDFPSEISVIGEHAFYGCNALEHIEIPANTSEIGMFAFAHCKNLYSVSIPANITTWGEYVFSQCDNLNKIKFEDGLKSLAIGMFINCDNLENVSLPYGIETVPCDVFNNSSLTSIEIPATVSSIDMSAFSFCNQLQGIYVDKDNGCYANYYNDGVLYSKDLSQLKLYPSGSLNTIYTFPKELLAVYGGSFTDNTVIEELYCVPSLLTNGDYTTGAFVGCVNLKKVSFSASTAEIDFAAFHGCSAINEYIVDESNKFFSSTDGILFSKDGTVLYKYPSGKTDSCYIIPNNISSVADYAFLDCSYLTHLISPNITDVDNSYVGKSATWYSGSKDAKIYYSYTPYGNVAVCNSDTIRSIDRASCEEDGSIEIICENCSRILKAEIIKKRNHNYAALTTNSDATCTKDGKKTYACQNTDETEYYKACNHLYTVIIPAIGHDYSGNYTVIKKASCTENGKKQQCCVRVNNGEVCNVVLDTVIIEMRSHNMSEWGENKKATCTETGEEIRYCLNSDETDEFLACPFFEIKNVPALGHDFGEWYIVHLSTYTEHGEERCDCSRCEVYKTRALPLLQKNQDDDKCSFFDAIIEFFVKLFEKIFNISC